MRKLVVFILFLFLAVNFNDIVMAFHPLTTDDAGTIEPGHLEIELVGEYLKEKSDNKEYSLTAALNTGFIWKRLDFGIEVPYLWLRPYEGENADGFGDLDARFKFRFYDETEKIPALAVKIGVKTETGDKNKDLGTGKVDFMADFIVEKGFGRFTLYGSAGYN